MARAIPPNYPSRRGLVSDGLRFFDPVDVNLFEAVSRELSEREWLRRLVSTMIQGHRQRS